VTPEPGAFGCVRTGGFVAWAIRRVTRSTVNHAFVYVGSGQIVEAQPSGARVSRVDRYPVVDWHQPPAGRGGAIAVRALALVGTPYGFADIVSVGLLQYGIRPRLLRAFVAREDRLICSQLVDLADDLAGVHDFTDGRSSGDVTPGDLHRLPIRR
jgi:hypothetical protein